MLFNFFKKPKTDIIHNYPFIDRKSSFTVSKRGKCNFLILGGWNFKFDNQFKIEIKNEADNSTIDFHWYKRLSNNFYEKKRTTRRYSS